MIPRGNIGSTDPEALQSNGVWTIDGNSSGKIPFDYGTLLVFCNPGGNYPVTLVCFSSSVSGSKVKFKSADGTWGSWK